MMLKANKRCPYCGKEIIGFNEDAWEYGRPVRRCKRCKKKYIDPRYHEIAIDGINPDAYNIRRSVIGMLIGLACVMITALVNLCFVYFNGCYSLKLVFAGFMGVVLAVILMVDVIRIKTGIKERHLEKLRRESEQRLQQMDYVQELINAGIEVPEKYLE